MYIQATQALGLELRVYPGLFCTLIRMASSDFVQRAPISRTLGLNSGSKAYIFENSEKFEAGSYFTQN